MIEVRGLTKSHGNRKVLDGVDLSVKPGEVAVIVGPSGGGKSTLLRCVNGLEPFEAGEVVVDGRLRLTPDLSHRQPAATLLELRRKVGMVFQQFHLFPNMNVLDNVTSGPVYALGRTREQADPEARKLLERVGLGEFADRAVDRLSGGQQQRVAIARALAVNPSAILFDEPTSALDPRMANEVLGVMRDLATAGQTMIVVTHSMGFARDVAHTVHVMHAGKFAESGPPAQLFGAPTSEVTRAFLRDTRAG